MRRFLGTVLIGFGALFVVLAVSLPLYVAPAVAKLPYDLRPCDKDSKPDDTGCLRPSVAEASGARFLQIKKTGEVIEIEVKSGTLRTSVEVIPDATMTAAEQKANRLGANAVVWAVYQSVRATNGDLISASSTQLALDRTTGGGIEWKGQWLDESESKDASIRYSDQIYKFPFGTEKKDYKIYDTDVRAASVAKYQSTEDVDGLEVYHFVQQIPDTAIEVDPGSLKTLLGRFATGATSGEIIYSNTREVWVDPVTGTYIKVRERQKKELRPNVGSPTVLLDADFNYTKDTTANAVAAAKANGLQLSLVRLWGPIALGVLAVLLLVFGFRLSRKAKDTEEPAAWDDGLPNPRHRLRGEAEAPAEATETSRVGAPPQ